MGGIVDLFTWRNILASCSSEHPRSPTSHGCPFQNLLQKKHSSCNFFFSLLVVGLHRFCGAVYRDLSIFLCYYNFEYFFKYILNSWIHKISHHYIYIIKILIMTKIERIKNREDLDSYIWRVRVCSNSISIQIFPGRFHRYTTRVY
jgi:hypothetical protein